MVKSPSLPAGRWWIAIAITLVFSSSALAFFDPSTGRWITRDPIGEKGGRNLYGFLVNQPLTLIDPFGEDVYELRRRNEVCGCAKHWYVLITDTGIKDPKGRPTITVINFTPTGWSVADTPGFKTIEEYMRFNSKDPSLAIVNHEAATHEESRALADTAKALDPSYYFLFNDCRHTMEKVIDELKKVRNTPPEPPVVPIYRPH